MMSRDGIGRTLDVLYATAELELFNVIEPMIEEILTMADFSILIVSSSLLVKDAARLKMGRNACK